jgi:hypothetical protein
MKKLSDIMGTIIEAEAMMQIIAVPFSTDVTVIIASNTW